MEQHLFNFFNSQTLFHFVLLAS